jgi:hypothetical protein
VLSANETADAEEMVSEAMQAAVRAAEAAATALGDGTYNDSTGATVDAGLLQGGVSPALATDPTAPATTPTRRLLNALARRLHGFVAGRKLMQDTLLASPSPLAVGACGRALGERSALPASLPRVCLPRVCLPPSAPVHHRHTHTSALSLPHGQTC